MSNIVKNPNAEAQDKWWADYEDFMSQLVENNKDVILISLTKVDGKLYHNMHIVHEDGHDMITQMATDLGRKLQWFLEGSPEVSVGADPSVPEDSPFRNPAPNTTHIKGGVPYGEKEGE